jgi:Flp pilus assembly CpaE family ATPase
MIIEIGFTEREVEILEKALADSISLRLNIEARFLGARRDSAARVYQLGTDNVEQLLSRVVGAANYQIRHAAQAQSQSEQKETHGEDK